MLHHTHIEVENIVHQPVKADFLVFLQVIRGDGAVAVERFVVRAHGDGTDYHRIAHQFFQFFAHNKNQRAGGGKRPHGD